MSKCGRQGTLSPDVHWTGALLLLIVRFALPDCVDCLSNPFSLPFPPEQRVTRIFIGFYALSSSIHKRKIELVPLA